MPSVSNDESAARKSLLIKIVVGLVGAGVVIGVLTGIVGATVIESAGIKESDDSETVETEPDDPAATDEDEESEESEDTDEEESSEDETPIEEKKPDAPELAASPASASAGSEVTLSGKFPGMRSGTLQVQRLEGGQWVDFPVTASIEPSGTFSTYIITSRSGSNEFRLMDLGSGKTTPKVNVRIS